MSSLSKYFLVKPVLTHVYKFPCADISTYTIVELLAICSVNDASFMTVAINGTVDRLSGILHGYLCAVGSALYAPLIHERPVDCQTYRLTRSHSILDGFMSYAAILASCDQAVKSTPAHVTYQHVTYQH